MLINNPNQQYCYMMEQNIFMNSILKLHKKDKKSILLKLEKDNKLII